MTKFFAVSAVTSRIKDYLSPAIAKEFWVRGELYNVSERGGHFYGSLIETSKSGRTIAKIEVRMWAGTHAKIAAKFKQAGLKLKIQTGIEYGFLCRISFHDVYGLALEIRDADPRFNLGEMERKRQEIIALLQKENRFEMNKRKTLPFLPQKIGLITSGSSAAYNDFMKTLDTSEWGFLVFLADARMQGENTEASIIKAMKTLAELSPDVVVITRGGGSKSDLYGLDNLTLARMISEYPVPVWTGIGHEIDTSVLDYVAHTSFKTPTAVAENLVAIYDSLKVNLDNSQDRLFYHWQKELERQLEFQKFALKQLVALPVNYLQNKKHLLQHKAQSLRNNTSGHIKRTQLNLQAFLHKLKASPQSDLQKHRLNLENYSNRFQLYKYTGIISEKKRLLKDYRKILRANDPVNNLKKGYSLVYDKDRKLIKSVQELTEKKTLITRLCDGEIESTVCHISEDKDGKK